MRSNKNRSKIILAVTVALLATLISYSGFKNMHNQMVEQQQLIAVMQKTTANSASAKESFTYAVSTVDLKAGEIVADTDVDFKQFNTQDANAFDNRSDVINKVLLKDIKSGETFTTSHIAKISSGDDLSLKDGYRALTLPAESFQGKSDSMKLGSSVDIYSASADNAWMLENVKILSLENGKNSLASGPPSITSASSITFEVPADGISDFIANISKSKLVLVARNANDQKISHKFSKPAHGGGFNANAMKLPNLPKSVPISNLPGDDGGNLSGLPQPIKPMVQQPSVEVIEANVKSKVTFD